MMRQLVITRPVLLVSTVLVLSGCSSSKYPRCIPVTGKVLLNKQPVAEAQVALHPRSGTLTTLPMAITNDKGEFTLTTFAAQDGAPEGEYIVTVELKQLVQQGEEKTRSGKNLLPPDYANPKKSSLNATVKPGGNDIVLELVR
jgi:hypothetical protein